MTKGKCRRKEILRSKAPDWESPMKVTYKKPLFACSLALFPLL